MVSREGKPDNNRVTLQKKPFWVYFFGFIIFIGATSMNLRTIAVTMLALI
jgi:hypothetical protein